jgi:hypothetical protein
MIVVNSLVEDITKLLFLEFVLRSQIVNDVGYIWCLLMSMKME